MKNLLLALCLLTSASSYAITFGPGPGGGGNDQSEKFEIKEDPKSPLIKEPTTEHTQEK